ncbi:MAG: hypothetical protein JOZ43_04935 [Acidobacteriales bacterium]|nr:hypothetical protein [Terriglobales bacterium]
MRYQTLRGIPLVLEFEWPVHASHSGSDWYVLHGRATVDDGSGLHADVAVNMSRAVIDALSSTAEENVRPVAINAVRKFLDTRDLELLKSGKRQPVNASSRVFSVVRKTWTFNDVTDTDLQGFLERKVFFDSLHAPKSWIADPVEALYLNSQRERLLTAARQLAQEGMIEFDGEFATPTAQLRNRSDEFQALTKSAIKDLEAKHAFERA